MYIKRHYHSETHKSEYKKENGAGVCCNFKVGCGKN